MDGIINVLKPIGMSSHDVVYQIRRIVGIKKVGHSGTLDPMAAGVLPIFIGKATRLIEYIEDDTKEYRCEMRLGFMSDTDDAWGAVKKTGHCSIDDYEKHLLAMQGDILQRPPDYSAVQVNGERLYKKARRGDEIKVEPRKVTIHGIDIVRTTGDTILFDITCSRGTYVRSICRDVGEATGCGAIMTGLIRTRSDQFEIKDSATFEELDEAVEDHLLPLDYAIDWMERIDLDQNGKKKFVEGMKIGKLKCSDGIVRIYGNDIFLGIAKVENGVLAPHKVIK